MPDKHYDDTAYYDFEKNYADAIQLIRQAFGDARADALLAQKGRSKRTDFMTALTWGWFLHRPGLPLTDRIICILGCLAPKGVEKGLRDYIQLGLAAGLHREKLREAMFIMSVYGGVPRAEWGLELVDAVCDELDKAGWLPFTPPGPLHEAPEHNYYDFDLNYPSGVDMSIRLFGARGNLREQRMGNMGSSSMNDFQAIHWGWLNQRPHLLPGERALFLIGLDSAVGGYAALRDHVLWAMDAGVERSGIIEAMNMLYLYNGWPLNRESMVTVTTLFTQLDAGTSGYYT